MYSSVLVYLNPLFCLLLDALLHAALYIKGPCFFVISLITVAQLSSTVESTAQTLNRNIGVRSGICSQPNGDYSHNQKCIQTTRAGETAGFYNFLDGRAEEQPS